MDDGLVNMAPSQHLLRTPTTLYLPVSSPHLFATPPPIFAHLAPLPLYTLIYYYLIIIVRKTWCITRTYRHCDIFTTPLLADDVVDNAQNRTDGTDTFVRVGPSYFRRRTLRLWTGWYCAPYLRAPARTFLVLVRYSMVRATATYLSRGCCACKAFCLPKHRTLSFAAFLIRTPLVRALCRAA